jgi:hypothetical protein
VQKGYIGTGSERRVIFIWEGVLAELPAKRLVHGMERLKCALKLWDQAVDYWEINDVVLKWMWSLFSRSDMRIDLWITTRPAAFGHAVTRLIERNNWPIRYVTALPAGELGRLLPTMPDVDRVYYGRPEQRWAYGPQGMLFPSVGRQIV